MELRVVEDASNDIELGSDSHRILRSGSDSSYEKLRSGSIYRTRADTFTPDAPDNAPSVLTFSNLNVRSKKNLENFIIRDGNGSITGGFWAIMGSSGSGKTTLLSTLSRRLDTAFMSIEGDIRLNGKEYTTHILKEMSAYVMQDDLVHADLTVMETISYAAQLRLPRKMNKKDREDRVQEVLEMMGILHCKNTIVGNTIRKGISGGERKRLCIAMELLSHPKLLFLDEPTSGLDSSTSLAICRTLHHISSTGECTVICTIHQPQQKIFELFDNLILMKKGVIVYQGSAFKSLKYFENLGAPVPPGENPADHILVQISPSAEELSKTSQQGQFIVPIDLTLGLDKPLFVNEKGISWFTQLTILLRRNIQTYLRRYDIIFMNLLVTLILATFVSQGIWKSIGTSQKSIATRAPSLFFACVTQGIVASLQNVNNFPSERALVLRERAAGSYNVSAYFMARTLCDLITQLWQPILFTCIVYPQIGYQESGKKFSIYMMFMMLDTFAATSVSAAVSCLCISVEMSTVVLAGIFEISRLYGGFFTSPAQLLEYDKWKFADALSYIKYAFVGVAINEFSGLELHCTDAQIAANTCITNGETIMDQKGYDQYTIQFAAGILVVYIVGCRILAFLALRFIKN